jgi:nucleoside-diphosphate-sugar epimerase
MRVIVIGGTGHIGTYLCPQLVEAGHSVLCVSRGAREPYQPHPLWEKVERVTLDRPAEEERNAFGPHIARLGGDAVIDITCYTLGSAVELMEALRERVRLLLHCGTIWVHGPSVEVPTTEAEPRRPFGDYGCRKAAIERYLMQEARRGFPVAALHPGHLVGPGWAPINPQANFNPRIFSDLAHGREVRLPNIGMETVHHVHASDVAQAFVRAVDRADAVRGESFHVVSPAALTLRGYAERMALWFGREPNLKFLPFEEWRSGEGEREAAHTWDHIAHSPNCSIEKARRALGYEPRYGSLEAVRESVQWLIEQGQVEAG